MLESVQSLDNSILLWIQDTLRNEIMDSIMIAYTTMGNSAAIWIIFSAALCCFQKTRKVGILILITIAFSYLVNDLIIKEIIERPRPIADVEKIVPLVEVRNPNSFPSGHTCAAFAVCGILYRTAPRHVTVICIIAASVMGFSRMYVGVHYPSDVFIGAVVGIVCSQTMWYIYSYWQNLRVINQ